jgi:hypothetical protein
MKEFLFGMFVVLFSTKSIVFAIIRNPRWPPLLKIEISSNGQKLLYLKPESAQI